MSDHHVTDFFWGLCAIAVSVLTSNQTLIFLGVVLMALRIWVTWRNRNKGP